MSPVFVSCETIPSDLMVAAWYPLLAEGNMLTTLAPFIGIALLFYFLLIRPEKRRQAQHRAQLEAIKKNDKVVTVGGIRGTVFSVRKEEDEVTIKVDDNTKLRLTISSIARIENDGGQGNDSK